MIAEKMQEHKQILLEWLEEKTPVQQRRFLEEHPSLLDDLSDQLLTDLEEEPGAPFDWTFLQRNREILQEARQCGGDIQAIRIVYVNRYSGFVLAFPDWLQGLVDEIEAADSYVFLKKQLQEALAHDQDELAPEALAELAHRLAQACIEQAQAEESPGFLVEALSYLKPARQTYTRDRYPYQFARVSYTTGRAYQLLSSTSKKPAVHIQQALTCYEEACSIWTRQAFASSWTFVQIKYIDALLDRYQYNGEESGLEQARSLAHELLFSNLPDQSDTLLITIYLVRVCFIYWFRTQDDEELEHGLSLAGIARDVAFATEYRSERAALLSLLGSFLGVHYIQSREKESLERSIQVRREVLSYALPSDGLLHLWEAQLSLGVLERYHLVWQAADLEEALQFSQQAIQHIEAKIRQTSKTLPEPGETVDEEVEISEQEFAAAYFARGYSLLAKHLSTWQINILNQAIVYLEKAVKCTPDFSPDFPTLLTVLSDALIRRHEVAENLTDIEEGIRQISSVLQRMSEDNTFFASQLYCVLGLYLGKRYELQGNYADLTLAIDVYRYALDHVPLGSTLYAVLNANLGTFLLKKHFTSGSREDIEEAVICCDNAVAVTEETSRLFPIYALNFAFALQGSYGYEADPAILEEALAILLKARTLLAENAPLQCDILLLIADILIQLYSSSGYQGYIDLARDITRQTLKIVAPTNPKLYLYLHSLSKVQALSYALTGNQAELQEIVKTSEQAIELMPAASPYRALISHSISISLLSRYERTGGLEDLERAISHLEKTIDSLSGSSPLYPAMQDGLGECYMDLFHQRDLLEDLAAALKHFELAAASADAGSSEQQVYRMHRGRAHLLYALVRQEFAGLHQAIVEMREALSNITPDSMQWHVCVNTFVEALCISYEFNDERAHLDEAIALSLEALKTTPDMVPRRVHLLVNLGRNMRARAMLPGQEEDRAKASAYFEEACEKGLDLSVESALHSAGLWGNWAALRRDWREAGRAYSYAIRALLLLYHEQVSLAHRHQRLAAARSLDTLGWNWVNIYEQAAYAQARAGLIRESVTSLELGRARELGERLARSKTNLQGLEQQQPELYRRYVAQVYYLQRLESADLMRSETLLNKEVGGAAAPLFEQIRQARMAHAETVMEIRSVPGYADFQLEPTYEQIAQVALPDIPLVYIVVTTMGSVALLVPAAGQEPEPIWADELTLNDLLLVRRQDGNLVGGYLAGQSVLDWMSNALTDSLPYVGESLIRRLAQRLAERAATGVVLISTGGSGMVPFHAAPYTLQGHEVSLIDQFEVSYIPSARVLATARNEANKRASRLAPHLLGVGNPLPSREEGEWAKTEIQRILQLLQESLEDHISLLNAQPVDDTPPPEFTSPTGKGNWALEERQRVLQQVQTLLVAHPSLLEDEDFSDPLLAPIALHSWRRAVLELQKQGAQRPAELIEQGARFRGWLEYFALFPELPPDILAAFEAICLRIPPALAYTDIEMESIQKLFIAQDATTFYGSKATRKALWTALPEASILHLSCHASFRADEPLESAFLLAQNTRLSLRDLLEADEQRLALLQLAVLPACQTAVTDMQNLPNEAIGLFAGFLHTGVPAVIGTLWSVEQRSAALLMIHFYDLYLDGDPSSDLPPQKPARALRQAQRWLRDLTYNALYAYLHEQASRHGRYKIFLELGSTVRAAQREKRGTLRPYAHPYYWAAFVYYGA